MCPFVSHCRGEPVCFFLPGCRNQPVCLLMSHWMAVPCVCSCPGGRVDLCLLLSHGRGGTMCPPRKASPEGVVALCPESPNHSNENLRRFHPSMGLTLTFPAILLMKHWHLAKHSTRARFLRAMSLIQEKLHAASERSPMRCHENRDCDRGPSGRDGAHGRGDRRTIPTCSIALRSRNGHYGNDERRRISASGSFR